MAYADANKNIIPSIYYGGGGYSFYVFKFIFAAPQYGDGPISGLNMNLIVTSARTVTTYLDSSLKNTLDNSGLFPIKGWVVLQNTRDFTTKNLSFTSNPKLEFEEFRKFFESESFVDVTYDIYLNESIGYEVLFTYQQPDEIPDYKILTHEIQGCTNFLPASNLLKGYASPFFHNLITGSPFYELKSFPVDLIRSVHSVPQLQFLKDSRLL